MAHVYGMELAVLRALIQFHSKRRRRLPSLPTYEQSLAAEERATMTPVKSKKPAWMAKYEEVNKERLLRKDDSDG